VQIGTSRVKLKLQVGIVQVQVILGGSAYSDNTQITFDGSEHDPVSHRFISDYHMRMHLAYVDAAQSYLIPATYNPYQAFGVTVNAIKAQLSGVTWQGVTRFDLDTCTFDACATQMVEQTAVTEVTWDQNQTIWDQQVTTFDRNWFHMYPQYSLTVFDQDRTVFDYYATLFDALPVTTQSAWSRSWVWFMGIHE